MKVAVIGAGASGLTAIKCCLDEGLEPVCYERTDEIGGLWNYKEETKPGQGSVMKSTVINTSKEVMCYSDFPIPTEYPIFMHNRYVQQYFHLYARQFDLMKHIKFQHEIVSIKKTADFASTGKWIVAVKDNVKGKTEELVYDAVMVCTGHHADINMPTFPGLDKFKGKVIHSHDYKQSGGYENKRVVIVGIGNSAGDAAVELSRVTSQGDVTLPSNTDMWKDIQAKKEEMSRSYVKSQRHTIQVDYISFQDELAKLTGCLPNFKKMLVTDPVLAFRCIFGPCTPYQYRLNGHGKWKGARRAIMTQWERTLAPLKTRPLGLDSRSTQTGFVLFYVAFVSIFVLFLYMLI